MKVALTLTITAPNETGLPSLPNSEVSMPSSPLGAAAIPADDPSQPQQSPSITSFDAVMAMFGLPQILPQQLFPVPTPIVVPVVNNAATQPLAGVDAAAMSRIPTIPSVVTVVEPNIPVSPAPATTDSTTALPTSSTPPLANEVNQLIQVFDPPEVSAQPTKVSWEANVASHLVPAEPMPLAATEVDASTSPPTPELPAHDVSFLHSFNEPVADLKPLVKFELPAIFDVPVMASDSIWAHEIVAVSRRLSEPRPEASEETPIRHRHATDNARTTVELTNSMSHAVEPFEHGPKQLDTHSLTEQLSVALQTHGDDLSAGKPIELRLRLDPPELGMVRVHLRLTDDTVSMRFIVGDEAVKRLIESQLPDLRQSLAERGLAFAQCDVMCDGRQHQSSSFGRDTKQPSFAPIRLTPRAWPSSLFANRSVIARTGRIDVLA